jgi:UDP-N-acetylmuramate--alanine ligase
MFDPQAVKKAHCVGIGGIHVSAVARLLKARGVTVSGSDGVQSEETDKLLGEGVMVTIGHAADHVPSDVDVIIYSDAVPEENPERDLARLRNIPSYDTHAFLGLLFQDAKQIVITGSHGKSTTTAMVGKILEAAGADPTVVVGTRVPGFPLGNLRIGRSDLLVVEGDEYRSHVLSYRPTVLAINNIEWDHPDVFPTAESYDALFIAAIAKVSSDGAVILNADGIHDGLLSRLMETAKQRGLKTVTVDQDDSFTLKIPGAMNLRNATMAMASVYTFDPTITADVLIQSLKDFPGVWRRFERVGTFNSASIVSDYAHHPTEVRETLKAARAAYPDQRLVVCYQPHQHARTKGLFADFVSVLGEPDVLVLAEIYDVPGRKEEKDADISSQKLIAAIGKGSYAPDIGDAERQLRALIQPNDLVLVMGAGPIDKVARNLVA